MKVTYLWPDDRPEEIVDVFNVARGDVLKLPNSEGDLEYVKVSNVYLKDNRLYAELRYGL